MGMREGLAEMMMLCCDILLLPLAYLLLVLVRVLVLLLMNLMVAAGQ